MRLLFQSKTFNAAAISTNLHDWIVHFTLFVRLTLGGGNQDSALFIKGFLGKVSHRLFEGTICLSIAACDEGAAPRAFVCLALGLAYLRDLKIVQGSFIGAII